jgi:hypothetical protein
MMHGGGVLFVIYRVGRTMRRFAILLLETSFREYTLIGVLII